MKNIISHRPVSLPINKAYTDMLERHAQRISLLKGGQQQDAPVHEDDQVQDEWAAVTHPDYTLLIYPEDDTQFTAWLLPFDQPPFSPALTSTIVYLYRPFVHGTEVELTMNDNVHWATEGQVMAAAAIEGVLYKDIVLKSQGIIIPVIVRPFHHFHPFSFENLRQYEKEASGDEDMGDATSQQAVCCAPVRCAHALPSKMGWSMLNYIDECRQD